MRTTRKTMYLKLTMMMVLLFVMSVQAFAGTFPRQTAITALKHPYSSIKLLSLYNKTGDTVYDSRIHKLLYIDDRGFFHWEQIGVIDEIRFLEIATVAVPAGAGLMVLYCIGEDGCSYSDRESTGSFGPLTSFRTTVTLY